MPDKWYVTMLTMLRQMFCWHKYTASEEEGIHWTCRKCNHSFTIWQLEADRWHNIAVKWQASYIELKDRCDNHD